MLDLLKKFINSDTTRYDLNDEELEKLGREISMFWEGNVWKVVIKPFLEDCVLNDAENLFTEGVNYTEKQMREIIGSVRRVKAFKDEFRDWEEKTRIATDRLKDKLKRSKEGTQNKGTRRNPPRR